MGAVLFEINIELLYTVNGIKNDIYLGEKHEK